MEIVTRQEERCLEIILKGELDHHGAHEIAGQLERSIESALPLRLVLDWSGVTFMDSSGIAAVMRARQRMRELGGSIVLRNAGPQPRKVLEAAGLDRFVTLE